MRAALKLKPLVFMASLAPFALQAWLAWSNQLGPHAYRIIVQETGRWSLWFVIFTLALTPLRRLTAAHWLARYRRMFGLFAFFYAAVHTLTYVGFDRIVGLDVPADGGAGSTVVALAASTMSDIYEKPFLFFGFIAFTLMVPLAATSTAGMIRRIGGYRWRQLHRLVYVAAIASLLHHWWPLGDRLRPDWYGVLIGVSLLARVARLPRRGHRSRNQPAGAAVGVSGMDL